MHRFAPDVLEVTIHQRTSRPTLPISPAQALDAESITNAFLSNAPLKVAPP